MRYLSALAALCLLALMPATGQARQAAEFGPYVIHYNAFGADVLHPQVARTYGIQRSRNRAVLNITVQRKQDGRAFGIPAEIEARAVNLTQQLRELNLRQVKEGDAIYYLADFPVSHREVLDFDLDVRPQGAPQSYNIQFRQQFFTRDD